MRSQTCTAMVFRFERGLCPRRLGGMLERGAEPPVEFFQRISSHVTALVFPILEEV
jgi:hypothetical protein